MSAMFLSAAMLALTAFEVVTVHDGDTITIRYEGTEQRVRFRGIDTPELWKPRCRREAELAARARAFVRARLRAARTITLVDVDTRSDPYGRWLAWVYVDGQSLAILTIEARLGRPWRAGGGRNNWCNQTWRVIARYWGTGLPVPLGQAGLLQGKDKRGYVRMLREVVGVASSTALDAAGRGAVIRHLRVNYVQTRCFEGADVSRGDHHAIGGGCRCDISIGGANGQACRPSFRHQLAIGL